MTATPYIPSTSGKFQKVISEIQDSNGNEIVFNQLVSEFYDYIGATYPSGTTEVYTYKQGGSGGTTVATLTVTFSDATKAQLTSVTRT